MKLILNEATYDPKNTYFADPKTKKVYQWNGSRFVEVHLKKQDISGPSGPGGPTPPTPPGGGKQPPTIITGKPDDNNPQNGNKGSKGGSKPIDFTDPSDNNQPNQSNDKENNPKPPKGKNTDSEDQKDKNKDHNDNGSDSDNKDTKDDDKRLKRKNSQNSDDNDSDKKDNESGQEDNTDKKDQSNKKNRNTQEDEESKDKNKDTDSDNIDNNSDQDKESKDTDNNSDKDPSKSDKKKTPQIGDKPDENDEESKRIADEEERQRQAEDDPRYESDEKARLQRIQDILDNPEDRATLDDENFRKVSKSRETRKEAQKRREKELKKYQDAQGIEGFVASITDFIKNEVKQQTIRTYSKLNKTYNSNTGPIIRRGKMTKKNDKIPKINVYYDQSASWSEADIKVGNAAIASLNQYVKKKQLIIDIYYFANRVSSSNSRSEIGGGTSGAPVIEHINQTRPDNVVIMTDSDTYYDNGPSATVPGGVWFLWKNGEKSQYFIDSLHGKKLTKQFDIKSGK